MGDDDTTHTDTMIQHTQMHTALHTHTVTKCHERVARIIIEMVDVLENVADSATDDSALISRPPCACASSYWICADEQRKCKQFLGPFAEHVCEGLIMLDAQFGRRVRCEYSAECEH